MGQELADIQEGGVRERMLFDGDQIWFDNNWFVAHEEVSINSLADYDSR